MKLKYTGLLIVLAGLLISSCKKQTTVFDNPYANGKSPLGIVTDPQQIPVPASGTAGTQVTITATGLVDYFKAGRLKFLFNGSDAHIESVTATGIVVTVPAKASSGITAFVVDGQLVFGPLFTVIGKVNLDPTYVNTVGADGAVVKAFPIPLSTQLMIMGNFTNYANAGVVRRTNRIVRVFADGSWDRSFLAGFGANSTVYSMAQVGAYYYIVGDLTGYAQQGGGISKIAKIQTSGLIDTTQVTTYTLRTRYVPSFNGGVTGGGIHAIYPVGTNKMIVTGGFTYYVSRRYDQNTYNAKDSTIIDSVDVRQLARLNDDGTLDKTWRFLPTAVGYKGLPGKSLPGANGPIATVQDPSGKILVYGQFTKFDDVAAGNIIRLNADGTIDPTFNAGSGTDAGIQRIEYSATLNKYIAVGLFNNYNGKPSQYMVQLNYDGSVDAGFTPKVFDGGIPYYAKALADGLIVLNGSFKSYDGVIRNGFAIINQTGALQDTYNTTGNLSGIILDTYETTSTDNKRALLIMGSFTSFDNKIKNNIVRVTLE
jgi:hypothetical protein